MSNELKLIFLVALALFVMQAVGGWFQIQNYKKAIRRMHKLGNVGVGQTKGRFLSGNLVLVACDSEGVITGVEVMEGLTFLTHFKPRKDFLGHPFVGASIDSFLELFQSFDKKQRKRHKGYIQAIEALELRLKKPELLETEPVGAAEPEPAPSV